MKPTRATARAGPEPVARQHHPRHARRRHAPPLYRRAVDHGAHLESDDLRQGDQRKCHLRRPHHRASGEGPRAGADVLRARDRGPARRGANVRADPRTHGRRGRLGLARGIPRCSPTTRRRPSRRWPSFIGGPTGNVFIKIPGTAAGREAIEESIFAGTPVNVTLLFSTEQYLGAAEAFMRGDRTPHRDRAGSQGSPRWPRSSSAAGTSRSPTRCPSKLRNRLGDRRSPPTPTARIASCSTPSAGSAWPTRAPGPRACSSRAPAPRIPTPPTSSTSTRSRPRSRSTRCPTRRCWRSPTTARSRPAARRRGRRQSVLDAVRGRGRRCRGAGRTPSARGR